MIFNLSERDARYMILVLTLVMIPCLIVDWMDRPVPKFQVQMMEKPMCNVSAIRKIAETLEPPEDEKISLGIFTAYAYCPCSTCCGQWSGNNLTASGTAPKEGRTIAADWNVLPSGTVIYIDGHQYVVEDTGYGIDDHMLDVFMESHEGALEFGVQQVEVTIKAPPTGVQDLSAAKKTITP